MATTIPIPIAKYLLLLDESMNNNELQNLIYSSHVILEFINGSPYMVMSLDNEQDAMWLTLKYQ